MSATFGDLISAVENHLTLYGMQRDQVTTLTSPISASATTLEVADATPVSQGLIEIDHELMAVKSKTGAGTLELHPWGRGQQGSVAAAHAANTKVTINPRFPRSGIAARVKETIRALYPDLYQARKTSTVSASAVQVAYELPSDFESVISVTTPEIGPSRRHTKLSRWSVDLSADPDVFFTGKSIDIWDALPGRLVLISYRARFGELVNESDTLFSVGLSDRWVDLIANGAAGQLVLAMENPRLQSDAVETQERSGAVQATQATTVARQLLGMYKTRLAEERAVLHRLHPPVMTRQIR